ncbi:MAG: hypothetical protein Q3M24_03690 [Candidatus Electrothrix aestuarii]|uniref:Uncharacterized protein n=1 Tax=Candidatus Electrothrix aestuarii TaxID=3062594 RepID=A0AAU8LYB3_9BACT|nr:hypothetical protein [Candidatus Electrothrix aestuarii]
MRKAADRFQLRTAEYAKHLGSTNVVMAEQPKLFVIGDNADVTVNFMDSGSYDLFVASLLSYGRYMLEVCDFSPIGA